MKDHFLLLARAGQWANRLLSDELARLTPAQWTSQSAVNFGSIQAIANHLVLADQAWLCRFGAQLPAPESVDAVPWPDFAEFRARRETTDADMLAFLRVLNPERMAGMLDYRSMSGQPCREPFALCLAHFFNHQTFHRGQMHALLGVHGIKAPNLDLIYFKDRQGAQRGSPA